MLDSVRPRNLIDWLIMRAGCPKKNNKEAARTEERDGLGFGLKGNRDAGFSAKETPTKPDGPGRI